MEDSKPREEQKPSRVTRGVLVRDGAYVRLTDLDTAGYLLKAKLSLVDAVKVSRYKYEITFFDPDKCAEDLAIRFVNSCCADYADSVARIKKVVHRFSGRDEGRVDARKNNGSNGHTRYPTSNSR